MQMTHFPLTLQLYRKYRAFILKKFLEKSWMVLISEDQQEIVQRAEQRGQRGISDRYELELCKKNGEIIDVLMSSSPIDPDDPTNGVTFTALDITEHKNAETRIQHQLRHLASIN